MMMEKVKDKIKEEKYQEAIELVRKEIKLEVTKLIRKECKNFQYTDIYNLISASEKYIKSDKRKIARVLYDSEDFIIDEKDELVILLKGYKKLVC